MARLVGGSTRRLVEALLAWHDPDDRALPFRPRRGAVADPWGVLVAEVMSQQTQAARAGERWTAFMRRFPTVEALAEAPTAAVIDAWVGLGYNRRAVNLQRAAAVIVAEHDGRIPDQPEDLLALPGVGPYTARAVLAFAHGWDVVPVDTNVARVLARTADSPLDRRTAEKRADELARVGGGPATAAALMDLGAAICRSRRPACERCPVQSLCRWAGGPSPDPAAAGALRSRPQGRFEGSPRQARGRIIRALADGPLGEQEATALAGAHVSVLDDLVAEGLVARSEEGFALPPGSGKA